MYWLAYRVRQPLDSGRGVATTIARSDDGVRFETVASVHREAFGAASLERPALVRRPDGGWRLYLSCSTPNSKHWWIEALDADDVAGLAEGRRTMVLPGDDLTGVKDPVVVRDPAGWRMWVCCHPLDDPDATDRMVTRYATSPDGLSWQVGPVALAGRPGHWDARGARITSVVPTGPGGERLLAYYDGRATSAENRDLPAGSESCTRSVAPGTSGASRPLTSTWVRTPSPAAATARPAPITQAGRTRRRIWGARLDPRISPAADGSDHRPACSGDSPSTSWRYCATNRK